MMNPDSQDRTLVHLARELASLRLNEDIAQEVWMVGASRPHTDATHGYWRTIARNLARSWHRSNERRLGRERWAHVEEPPPSAETLLHRARVLRCLQESLNELPIEQREAVTMRFLEGASIAGVAKRQGVAQGTADSRIRKGLARLRASLDERLGCDRNPWHCLFLPPIGVEATQASGSSIGGKHLFVGAVVTSAALALWAVPSTTTAAPSAGLAKASLGEMPSPRSSKTSTSKGSALEKTTPGNTTTPPSTPKGSEKTTIAENATTLASTSFASPWGPVSVRIVEKPERQTHIGEWYWEEYGEQPSGPELIGRLSELRQATADCYEDLVRRQPDDFDGNDRLRLDIHFVQTDQAKLLVSQSKVSQAFTKIDDADFLECIEENGFLLDDTPSRSDFVRVYAQFEALSAPSPDALRAFQCLGVTAEDSPEHMLASILDTGLTANLLECVFHARGLSVGEPPQWTRKESSTGPRSAPSAP